MGHEKLKILEIIKKIEHTGGSTSAVEGAKLAIAVRESIEFSLGEDFRDCYQINGLMLN